MDPLIGQILLFAGDFAPVGWAFCHGQLLPIAQNTALFSILGATYGGNGSTHFALPDLRGRTPVGFGQGTGLSNYALGQQTGVENVTLAVNQIPAHNHQLNALAERGTTIVPTDNALAQGIHPGGAANIYAAPGAFVAMNAGSISNAGGGQPHSNVQPVLAMNYIIALQGIYPSRS